MEQSLNHYIKEYHKQLELGNVQKGYKGLIDYIMTLRSHFINKYPEGYVVGSLHQGYMDISYFPFTPLDLNIKKLKFAIVYNHSKSQFEIWLAGQNKQVQKKYWEIIKNKNLTNYSIQPDPQYAIITKVLVEKPNFNGLDDLTEQIETRSLEFGNDIINLLNNIT